jgi:ASC-1-like (ASCH) protein
MEHESNLQTPYYEFVRDGVKIYELRVNDEKRQKMKEGDTWVFSHSSDKELPRYKTKITEVKLFVSFESAIDDTGYEQLLPEAKSVEEAVVTYNGFGDGAYERDAKKYGVVRFKLELI